MSHAYGHDVRMALCLDPEKIDAEFDRIRKAAFQLGLAYEAAAYHEIDENHKRVNRLKLAIGKDFLQVALSMDAKNLKGAGVDFALDALGALGDYAIEGNDADLRDTVWH